MATRSDDRVRVVQREHRVSPAYAASRFVYALASVLIVILTFRFLLRLFGANPEAGFVQFVYAISAPLVAPFVAVFPNMSVEGAAFEWNSLLAMAVYAVIAWGVSSLILSLRSRSHSEVIESVHEDTSTHTHDSVNR